MKKILTLCFLSLCLVVPVQGKEFQDVKTTDWYYSYVNTMSDMGMIAGYDDGTFRPEENVTLTEFSILLANAFYGTSLEMVSCEVNTSNGNSWWEPYINTVSLRDGYQYTALGDAVAAQLKKGYRFSDWENYLNVPLTRYDVASMAANVIIDRYIDRYDAEHAVSLLLNTTDVNGESNYGISVAMVYDFGIMSGTGNNQFSGNQLFTRAEATVVLYNMVQSQRIPLEKKENASIILGSTEYNMSSYNHTGNLAMENYVFARVNELRIAKGLNPVVPNNTLVEYAYIRAQETEHVWSHTRPDGTAWYTVISPTDTQNNLKGENLTMGSGFYEYEFADMIFKSWLNSPSHYQNMITATHQQLGLAVYINNNGSYYATQIFGIPQ